jgi:hypothetical protein
MVTPLYAERRAAQGLSPGTELGCDRRPAQHAYVGRQHAVEGGGVVQLLCHRHRLLAYTRRGAQLQSHHLWCRHHSQAQTQQCVDSSYTGERLTYGS